LHTITELSRSGLSKGLITSGQTHTQTDTQTHAIQNITMPHLWVVKCRNVLHYWMDSN